MRPGEYNSNIFSTPTPCITLRKVNTDPSPLLARAIQIPVNELRPVPEAGSANVTLR